MSGAKSGEPQGGSRPREGQRHGLQGWVQSGFRGKGPELRPEDTWPATPTRPQVDVPVNGGTPGARGSRAGGVNGDPWVLQAEFKATVPQLSDLRPGPCVDEGYMVHRHVGTVPWGGQQLNA